MVEITESDKIMGRLEKKINSEPNMPNVRWYAKGEIELTQRHKNEPNFWCGMAMGMLQRGLLEKQEAIDIAMALKANGADDDYVQALARLAMGQ